MKTKVVLLSAVAAGLWLTGCATIGGKGVTFVAAVNCGGAAVQAGGITWAADQVVGGTETWGAVGGKTAQQPGLAIADTDMPTLYQSERFSMEAYHFAVPNGTYQIVLHFAETYEGITGPGQRVFGVSVNGTQVEENLDPLTRAGASATPLVVYVEGVKVTDGKLRVEFTPGVENPEINAILVVGR